jgi:protein-S-isoprenylcysteine O-methyltransferase Ste14
MSNPFFLRSGNFFFRFRRFLFPAFALAVLLLTRPEYFLGRPDLDAVVVPLAIACALLGGLFRLLVIGFAYIKRGGKDNRVYADDLVTEGFYAHVRNPMYIGNFLIVVGLGTIYGSRWIYFVLIPFFAYAYFSIVVAEEDYLRKKFGATYDAYEKRVNRFFPDFRGIRKSLRDFRYDWRKALRKDYSTFSGVVTGCIGAVILKRHYLEDLPRDKLVLWFGITAIVVFGGFCGTVRYLKGAGLLRSPAE